MGSGGSRPLPAPADDLQLLAAERLKRSDNCAPPPRGAHRARKHSREIAARRHGPRCLPERTDAGSAIAPEPSASPAPAASAHRNRGRSGPCPIPPWPGGRPPAPVSPAPAPEAGNCPAAADIGPVRRRSRRVAVRVVVLRRCRGCRRMQPAMINATQDHCAAPDQFGSAPGVAASPAASASPPPTVTV